MLGIGIGGVGSSGGGTVTKEVISLKKWYTIVSGDWGIGRLLVDLTDKTKIEFTSLSCSANGSMLLYQGDGTDSTKLKKTWTNGATESGYDVSSLSGEYTLYMASSNTNGVVSGLKIS